MGQEVTLWLGWSDALIRQEVTQKNFPKVLEGGGVQKLSWWCEDRGTDGWIAGWGGGLIDR